MRTTTKKLENAVTQIKVTFDKKEWAEAQDAALKRLATRVKLDGFRPGKAPVAMIKARLGKQAIYDEATDQILQKRYADIMKKAEVAPIAQPTLNIDSVDNDNLKITILCPVKPEVELGEYKGLDAGASAVSVGTANFHNPAVTMEVIDGIEAYMKKNGFESVKDMVGIVK